MYIFMCPFKAAISASNIPAQHYVNRYLHNSFTDWIDPQASLQASVQDGTVDCHHLIQYTFF